MGRVPSPSERKYEVSLKARVPRLAANGQGRTPEDPVEQTLEADYYDTGDFRLTKAGISVLRTCADPGWRVRWRAGGTLRELRFPLGDKEKVPDRIATLVRAFTHDRKLRPIARLRTDRFTHRLADAAGRTLATLTDDHVSGEILSGRTLGLDRWRELSVEPGPETAPELVRGLHRELRKHGARNAWWPSKLQRLIGEIDFGDGGERGARARWCTLTLTSSSSGCAGLTWGSVPARRIPCTRCGWRPGSCGARSRRSPR